MKCEKENDAARACITIFRDCHRSRVPCVLTHALSSFLFATPEICALIQLDSAAMTSADCCQYGTAWRKSTRFFSCQFHEERATSNPAPMQRTTMLFPRALAYRPYYPKPLRLDRAGEVLPMDEPTGLDLTSFPTGFLVTRLFTHICPR